MKMQLLVQLTLLMMLLSQRPVNAQIQPPIADILAACTSGKTESLPVPFNDIPENHWAKNAVTNLYYCGGFPLLANEQLEQDFLSQTPSQTPSSVDIDILLSAPETLKIDNKTYNVEIYLWRDFMPGIGSKTNPLMASITISPQEGKIKQSLLFDRLWLFKNDKLLWETKLTSQGQTAAGNQIQSRADNGPLIPTGIAFDVVISLKDQKTNQIYYFKKLHQVVQRTD